MMTTTVHTRDKEMVTPLSNLEMKTVCLEAGADDCGFVEVSSSALDADRDEIEQIFPWTVSVIVLAQRMHRDSIRSPRHSCANIETKQTCESLSATTRRVMLALQKKGVRAVSESWGFPMEANHWPGKMWFLSHKNLAFAAGLGVMGKNRLILHPQFGPFLYFESIIINAKMDRYHQPVDHSPCLECNLCVTACPTGAINKRDGFNFNSCVTHNYRNKLGGFSAWVEQVVESTSAAEYRSKVDDQETLTMWHNLSHGSNTLCDHCVGVCPAGSDAEPEYSANKKKYIQDWVKPRQQSKEKVYVIPGSDAEASVIKRFPHKEIRRVANNIRPLSIASFLDNMAYLFQPGQSVGLRATYHFFFRGREKIWATVTINNQNLSVERGHHGKPSIKIYADSEAWIKFLAKEKSIVTAILTLKVVVAGDPRLLLAFGRCFPS